MTVTWIELVDDSGGDDNITPLLAALATATAPIYAGTPVQATRVADNGNILVKANIEDADRTGDLAEIARDQLGVGIFADEFVGHADKDRRVFSALAEDIPTYHVRPRSSYTGGAWVRITSYGDDSGDNYQNALAGAKGYKDAGITGPHRVYWIGEHYVTEVDQGSDGGVTAAGAIPFVSGSDGSPVEHRFDYPEIEINGDLFDRGVFYGGTIFDDGNGNSWTDNSDGTFTYPDLNANYGAQSFFYDCGSAFGQPLDKTQVTSRVMHFRTQEVRDADGCRELVKVDSLAECQALPGSVYAASYAGSSATTPWTVHLHDGSDPTDRVMGNDYGVHWDSAGGAAEEEYIDVIGWVQRLSGGFRKWPSNLLIEDFSTKFINNLGSGTGYMFHIRFDGGVTGDCTDVTWRNGYIARCVSAIYNVRGAEDTLMSRRGVIDTVLCEDIGGARTYETGNDGHAIGSQGGWEDLTVTQFTALRCGGHFTIYQWPDTALHIWGTQRWSDIECQETAEFFAQLGSDSADNLLHLSGNNDIDDDPLQDSSDIVITRVYLRGAVNCFRLKFYDNPVVVSFMDMDGASNACVKFQGGDGTRGHQLQISDSRFGAGPTWWLDDGNVASAANDWLWVANDNVFVGDESDAKLKSNEFGSSGQTLANWQGNSRTDFVFDTDSFVEAA